jgi:hypothetical protein
MFTLLILACVCADESPAAKLPANVRAYFQRGEESRAAKQVDCETKISDLEVAMRGRTEASKKKMQKYQKELKKELAELQRLTPVTYLSNAPFLQIDEIGVLPSHFTVHVVVDDTTAVVLNDRTRGNGTMFILSDVPTRTLKVGQPVSLPSIAAWKVTAKSTDDPKLLRIVELSDPYKYFVLEPVKKTDMDKYRVQYAAEKEPALEGKTTASQEK